MTEPTTNESRQPSASLLLRVAPVVLLGAGAAVIVGLHVLRTDVHPALYYVSEYGNEAWSWLFAGGLLLVAAGLFALASSLRTELGSRLSPRLLQLAGAMLIVAALFSTDRNGGEVVSATLSGQIHGLMSIGAFCVLVIAMAALSPRLEGHAGRLGRLGELSLPLAVAGPTLAALAYVLAPGVDGLRQRAFLAIVFGWLLATAFQLYALGRDRPRGVEEPEPANETA